MRDFLTFCKMLSPILIQIAFWIAVGFFIYTAIVDLTRQVSYLTVLEVIILGPLAARILCEVLILFFRINNNLEEIRKTLAKEQLAKGMMQGQGD